MFTYKATSFSLIGFSMVLIAAFFSGIRWTLSQLIMQKSKLGLENPVDFIFHIQPLMILSLLPIAIGVEGTIKVNALSRLKIFSLKFVIKLLQQCLVCCWSKKRIKLKLRSVKKEALYSITENSVSKIILDQKVLKI